MKKIIIFILIFVVQHSNGLELSDIKKLNENLEKLKELKEPAELFIKFVQSDFFKTIVSGAPGGGTISVAITSITSVFMETEELAYEKYFKQIFDKLDGLGEKSDRIESEV